MVLYDLYYTMTVVEYNSVFSGIALKCTTKLNVQHGIKFEVSRPTAFFEAAVSDASPVHMSRLGFDVNVNV